MTTLTNTVFLAIDRHSECGLSDVQRQMIPRIRHSSSCTIQSTIPISVVTESDMKTILRSDDENSWVSLVIAASTMKYALPIARERRDFNIHFQVHTVPYVYSSNLLVLGRFYQIQLGNAIRCAMRNQTRRFRVLVS